MLLSALLSDLRSQLAALEPGIVCGPGSAAVQGERAAPSLLTARRAPGANPIPPPVVKVYPALPSTTPGAPTRDPGALLIVDDVLTLTLTTETSALDPVASQAALLDAEQLVLARVLDRGFSTPRRLSYRGSSRAFAAVGAGGLSSITLTLTIEHRAIRPATE